MQFNRTAASLGVYLVSIAFSPRGNADAVSPLPPNHYGVPTVDAARESMASWGYEKEKSIDALNRSSAVTKPSVDWTTSASQRPKQEPSVAEKNFAELKTLVEGFLTAPDATADSRVFGLPKFNAQCRAKAAITRLQTVAQRLTPEQISGWPASRLQLVKQNCCVIGQKAEAVSARILGEITKVKERPFKPNENQRAMIEAALDRLEPYQTAVDQANFLMSPPIYAGDELDIPRCDLKMKWALDKTSGADIYVFEETTDLGPGKTETWIFSVKASDGSLLSPIKK